MSVRLITGNCDDTHGADYGMARPSPASPIGRWLRDLLARQHKNVVVVALANKLARICWAVLAGERGFAEEAVAMR